MKRMAYIVIMVAGLVVAGLILTSCFNTAKPINTTTLVGMSVSQNHMNFGDCYNFYLRLEGNQVLFDADVRFDEEPYSIILESCSVELDVIEELKRLDNKLSITNYVTTYKSSPSVFNVTDKTTNKTVVYLSDETYKTAETKDEHIEILYNFFFELAKKHINQSVYIHEE